MTRRFWIGCRRTGAALTTLAALAVAGPLGAQVREEARLARGVISGSIVDAESGAGLAGATVVVEPEAGGAMPARLEGGSFLQGAQGMISDAEGRYRFADLAPGRYRLRASRAGYRAAAITVELRGAADSRVSVGLSVEPIPLESVSVVAEPAPPYGRDRSLEAEVQGSREAVARRRQREQLASDARELTHADVVESVTLGETDLFRALQRLPGVSTRSDYTAELWVRGSQWDQTRIYLDGLPLLNPLHGLGLFSGVNPDAVGGALLLPGVRSASLGEGAAAVVDLTSRRGGGEGEVRGSADLSLASARLALDQRVFDGRAAWMLSARRTYLDWLAAGIGRLIDDPEASVPYAFSDLTGRLDFQIDGARAVEVSGFHQSDRVTGDVPDVLHRTRARWGNTGGRVSYAQPVLGLQARHTVGFSRYAAVVREAEPDPALEDRYSAPGEPRADNEFDHLVVSGQASPAGDAWRAGYALTRQGARYSGPFHHVMGGWRSDPALPLERAAGLTQAALWGERRWAASPRLTMEAGIRLEAGAAVRGSGVLRPAPRASARYTLSPDVSVAAGIGRSHQYSQALAPVGPSVGPGLQASQLWLLAGPEVPALRADVVTLGGEAWLGRGWLASANSYVRRSTGVVLPDPTPGPLAGRSLFVTGESLARGLELSARRLAGRWTSSLAYSYGVSELRAEGLRFPAPSDRRHLLDATAMARLGTRLRAGAAFTAASGAPYTRVYAPDWSCSWSRECGDREPRTLEPGAFRMPAHASLDLLLDYGWRVRGVEAGAYLQLRNALGRENAATYSSTGDWCPGDQGGYTGQCPQGFVMHDRFEPGLPLLPVLGFRARF
jgi:hypothetical protein